MEIDENKFDSAIEGLEKGQATLKEGQKKLIGGQAKLMKEIKRVHSDLIKHDERANDVMQKLLDVQELQKVVGRMRLILREELNIEV